MTKFDRWVGYWAMNDDFSRTLDELGRGGNEPELDCLVVRTEEEKTTLKAYLLVHGLAYSVAVNEIPQGMSRAFIPLEDFPTHVAGPRNG